MTRSGTGETVRLSIGSWIAIVTAVLGVVFSQWAAILSATATVREEQVRQKAVIESNERRISSVENKLDKQRDEWIGELRQLRQDLKAK